jgi:hypothetical protein
VQRTFTVDAMKRGTLYAGDVPDLVGRSFAMTVESTQPVVAERAVYLGQKRHWDGGTVAMGVTAPSTTWYFAEGATGPTFEMYLLLANPNADPLTATVTYLLANGTTVVKDYVVNGMQRRTVWVEGEAGALNRATGLGVVVRADLPVLAERAMYWPSGYANWRDGHATTGAPGPGTQWVVAEGIAGGANQAETFLLLANPDVTASQVEITYLRENGLEPVVKTYTVDPTSRLTIWVNGTPELSDGRFGAVVTVVGGSPIIVERATYWSKDGTWWAAGSGALGVRVR